MIASGLAVLVFCLAAGKADDAVKAALALHSRVNDLSATVEGDNVAVHPLQLPTRDFAFSGRVWYRSDDNRFRSDVELHEGIVWKNAVGTAYGVRAISLDPAKDPATYPMQFSRRPTDYDMKPQLSYMAIWIAPYFRRMAEKPNAAMASVGREEIDGRMCEILKTRGNGLPERFWIDLERGGAIAAWERRSPTGKLVERLTGLRFAEVKDGAGASHWLPTEGKVQYTMGYKPAPAGKKGGTTFFGAEADFLDEGVPAYEHRLHVIDGPFVNRGVGEGALKLTFDNRYPLVEEAGSIPVKDYTPVRDPVAERAAYKRAMKIEDLDAVEIERRSRLRPWWSGISWSVGCGALALACAAAAAWHRWRQGS